MWFNIKLINHMPFITNDTLKAWRRFRRASREAGLHQGLGMSGLGCSA